MSNHITKNRAPLTSDAAASAMKKEILTAAPLTAADFSSRIEDLSVDTLSLINRDTKIESLNKIVKRRGGFDGDLWQPPRAGRIRATGEVFIFDGDHSRHLYKIFHPEAKTMPIQVIDVDSKEEIHILFRDANATCKTQISPDQIFVHNVHARDKTAMKYSAAAEAAGLYVYCSSEPGGTAGDPSGEEIHFSDLKTAFHSASDTQILSEAKKLIMSCKNSLGKKNVIPGPLFRSLCLVLSAYPDLRPGQDCGQEFTQFLVESVGNKTPERYGKNIERDCRSGLAKSYRMAAGLIQEINDYQKDRPGTFKAVSKGAQSRIMMSDLKRYGDKKRSLQGNRSKKNFKNE